MYIVVIKLHFAKSDHAGAEGQSALVYLVYISSYLFNVISSHCFLKLSSLFAGNSSLQFYITAVLLNFAIKTQAREPKQ